MEEKALIKSIRKERKINEKKAVILTLAITGIVSVILSVAVFLITASVYKGWAERSHYTSSAVRRMSLIEFANSSYAEGKPQLFGLLAFFGVLILAGIIVFIILVLSGTLVVTDKRIYSTQMFGGRVDLPLDSVSAVKTSPFKSIVISTSAGTIRASFIKNRDAIYETVCKLLIERQGKKS